jgi:proton-coupled amino acid transporter
LLVILDVFQKRVPIQYLIFPQLLFYLPICLLRQVNKLYPLAIVADVFILLGIMVVLYFDSAVLSFTGVAKIQLVNYVDYPYFLGKS